MTKINLEIELTIPDEFKEEAILALQHTLLDITEKNIREDFGPNAWGGYDGAYVRWLEGKISSFWGSRQLKRDYGKREEENEDVF